MRSCSALYKADADTYLAESHQHRLRISATTWRMCMFWWLESRNSPVSNPPRARNMYMLNHHAARPGHDNVRTFGQRATQRNRDRIVGFQDRSHPVPCCGACCYIPVVSQRTLALGGMAAAHV